MADADHPKPIPARHSEGRGKPTPVRELNGDSAPPPAEIDVVEVGLETEDGRWTVRVLGRSGSASGAAPPLLLLGFWAEADGERPSLEALIAASALADLSPGALRLALSRASPPPDPSRRRPFFAEASQNRRR